MRKIITLFILVFLVSACNKKFDDAMKSADKNLILQTANEYFANQKWTQAIALYERLPNLVAGTDDAKTVVFNTAYANYYDKQYRVAAHHFKNFSVTFPEDPRAEEAAYMSAICYYEGSMDYNLDQKNTESAINELQNFLTNYPNSEKAKNINERIDDLSYKLEFKAFENARQYFKMNEYKAAVVAFENVLADFPSTKLRPKINDYILKSKYHLAMNSIYDKKEDRLNEAVAYTRFIEKEMPDTDTYKTALDYREKLEAEKVRFAKVKEQVEAEKVRIAEKQKAAQAELDAKEKKKEDQILQKAEADAQQVKVDSAAAAQPQSGATFKIKRN
ncbi:outer membrane protein assembly factor BamD [Chryseobacterium taklimakanense]|uniref:outer membrane protein assembly factor BamD n=1 Tax=Chryseobacterium taklimakanense TaxID=536441 RepID=UPI000F5D5703|nr:outer membrane protein assembly factor BamD [Chryseobacterium taklimakanense]AZI21590.1 outer membrane protein assembly factor BamD [Chryseobacterium taklimakanense]